MKMNKIRLNPQQRELYIEVAKHILKKALLGTMIAIAMTSPYFASNFLKAYERSKKRKFSEKDLDKVLKKFKKDRLVSFFEKNGKEYLKITERGRRQLIEFDIDTIEIKNRKWDGKFRAVFFDIPEEKRVARRVLRDKLKEIGFIQLQKSVWACPYECQDEISFISSVYEVEKFVNYAVLAKVDNAQYLKSKFDL